MTPVRYTVAPANPREHLFEVRCTVATPAPGGQVLRLPSWIRGSYLVRDFAKHVIGLRASSKGAPLAFERLDKSSLRCAPCSGPLQLDYSVFAFDESVRKAWLDLRRGFFNGSSLFYCPAGFERGAFEVEIAAPADPACAGWKLATTLEPVRADASGFGVYRAADYEELIDHPVEMGSFEQIDFHVDGIPHALVLAGRIDPDRERLARDLAKICHVERELFGQEPPLRQYLFLANVTGAGYGGLEHRSSTALVCARSDLPRPGDTRLTREYRGFLGLCSHEYFHLWNVKRIAPQAFLESDLGAEAYTQDLWHYEGVTAYYDDLFLLRAGVLDAPGYLDLLAEAATRLERTPGRHRQTLAEASFEAWIKYYQPDENAPNATTSYYIKGALAALCLDLTLRLRSAVTLDQVMRALWDRYGRRGLGVPERGLEQVAQELSGLELAPLFESMLRSTAELPLAPLLAEFGVEVLQRMQLGDTDNGGRAAGEPPLAHLGLRLRAGELRVAHVVAGSPAAHAGVSPNDLVLALDGLRASPATFARDAARLRPGVAVPLHVFRGDELLALGIVPEPPLADCWTFTLAQVEGERLLRRQQWLGA
ncbi:MAG TPA: PDZ domain-containing protein [Solimonas sp.]|nr:PDZ domain-containing protein [Solimonas sp.]